MTKMNADRNAIIYHSESEPHQLRFDKKSPTPVNTIDIKNYNKFIPKIMFLIIIVSTPFAFCLELHQLRCNTIFSGTNVDKLITNLVKLHFKLELAKIQGTSSLTLTALAYDYKIKEQNLTSHIISNNLMTISELKKNINLKVSELQTNEENILKEETLKKIEEKNNLDLFNLSQKIIFHELQSGKFTISENKKNIEINIKKPFAMMATPMTQMQWARLKAAMGEKNHKKINPSVFKDGNDSVSFSNFEGTGFVIYMQPNHPVEHVSWNDIKEFIDELNILSNSTKIKNIELLKTLIPGHKEGDIYDLSTEQQWEYVIRNRGLANKKYFDTDEPTEVQNYAWYSTNSRSAEHPDGSTQAVATRQPRIIDGKPFYDLEGNVWEWMKDICEKYKSGRQDVLAIEPNRTLRGSAWSSGLDRLHIGNDGGLDPNYSFSGTGFRLVRTRP